MEFLGARGCFSWRRCARVLLAVALLLPQMAHRSVSSSLLVPAEISASSRLGCNQYQLLTCLGSQSGAPQDDCCDAIRNVLNPGCVCSPEYPGHNMLLFVISILFPIPALAVAKDKECTYGVNIKTGCVQWAGTDADVDVTFTTLLGTSVQFTLDNPGIDDFEICSLSTFTGLVANCLQAFDPVCRMVLHHNNKGKNPGWFVDWVEYIPPFSQNHMSRPVSFNVNAWLQDNSLTYTADAC
ncbi:hypothetical protein SELMODRAFT_403057 [Selaginella moellendorffii]|uniref:PLAT domain-containing protein n=1 Tax=Selaginella moellendorffii TaxID=88036 RepID=D8QNX2_SELML|nr:hypothetical protein SELMODRAFT_403057 [Selaginella moellendorffii]